MKLISNSTSLSIAAILLLQSGSFVTATPFFNVPAGSATHNNDASTGTNCQDFRVTYPSSSGISFEEDTKHVIAWNLAAGMKQVNITMVDSANPSNQAYIGTFDAKRGATDEVALSLKGQEAGEFHFHLAGLGDNSFCEADSTAFRITKRQQQTSTDDLPSAQAIASSNQTETDSGSAVNEEEVDRILEDIQASSQDNDSSENEHTNDSTWGDALDNVASITRQSSEKQQQPHQNDASAANTNAKGQSFYDYINSLDQDYKKYIHKNKETEGVAVTHKNDVDTNPYFTNEDRTTLHNNKAEKTWHSDDVSSNSNPYFTNEDRTTKHNNAAPEKTWHSDDAAVSAEKAPKTWHSNDADNYFTNEYQTSQSSKTHQNDSNWVAEETDDEPQQHLNGWTSEDNELEADDHMNSAEWDLPHSNDAGWQSEDEEDEEHINGWTSDEIDVAPTHANYHQNDTEWVVEGDNDHTHNNGWISEDADEQVAAPHVNYAEWTGDGEEDAAQHYNTAEWQSGDTKLSAGEHPNYHRNDNEWESEDTDLTSEEHHNYHINDVEWVSEESNDSHANAADWESEDVDLAAEDHPNYHINSNEWVTEDASGHNNEADANDWQAEEDDITPEEHANYHINKAEWVSEGAATMTSHENYHINYTEWESEDDNQRVDAQHKDAADWVTEDTPLTQEDHSNYHQNTVEWVAEGDKTEKQHNNAASSNGWTSEEKSHPNYHINKAEWVSADGASDKHNNAADWESEDVELSTEEHRNYHINDVEWTSEDSESAPHVNLANWVATPTSSQGQHSNAAAEWETEELDLLSNDHTNLKDWEAVPAHSNDASKKWVSEDVHLDEEDTHLNAAAAANTNTREWVDNDAPSSPSNHIPEEINLLQTDHTNGAWMSSSSTANPQNTQHSNAVGAPPAKQWQDESNGPAFATNTATTSSHTNEWVSW